ncbi:hypothetical protein [Nocardia sp. CC201C]|uniref:hypothetical protein n=1 Tax=Nocardia sp. CC201C TaxID=3044575 RepID=UPI0024A8FF8A|nr:hypothetical protein [Nocardia sp. CC201C]
MSAVESVGLWVGLLSGVVGVVLATVSITFTYLVEKRASQISIQMIQSLQKIETVVERTTADTSELISVAWNRLLPPAAGVDDENIRKQPDISPGQISSGAIAELREELLRVNGTDSERIDALNAAIETLRQSIDAHLVMSSAANFDPIAQTRRRLLSLSPYSLALVNEISGNVHLTYKQYRLLMRDRECRLALEELRRESILFPLEGIGSDGEPVPVYWLDPAISKIVPALLQSVPSPPEDISEKVSRLLDSISYPGDESGPGSGN